MPFFVGPAGVGQRELAEAGAMAGQSPVETPMQTASIMDQAVAEPPAVDGPDDPNAALEAALASLTGTFDELLSRLRDLVGASRQLPDPSPPSGHGAAYDRFLSIYNELRGQTPGVDEIG